jgi:hypothetical protein
MAARRLGAGQPDLGLDQGEQINWNSANGRHTDPRQPMTAPWQNTFVVSQRARLPNQGVSYIALRMRTTCATREQLRYWRI